MNERPIAKPCREEFHRKPTPWPPFDVEAFARDSERRIRAAEARATTSTAPPPPNHPASIAAIALDPAGESPESTSALDLLDAEDAEKTPTAPPPPTTHALVAARTSRGPLRGISLVPAPGLGSVRAPALASVRVPAELAPAEPELVAVDGWNAMLTRMGDCTARIAPLLARLSTGDVSREEGASLVRLQLNALEAEARDALAEPFAALLVMLRDVVEKLGGIGGFTSSTPLEVIVVDEDAAVRERIALAVASMGHLARSAKGLHELPDLVRDTAPDAIFVAAAVHGAEPGAGFCRSVREIAGVERARIAVFTTEAALALDDLARDTGAEHCFRAASPAVERIAAQVAPVLYDLAEAAERAI